MAGLKIVGFAGTAPKISPELLPNTAGQIAKNCKLYSGDLIPYPQAKLVDTANRTGHIKTLFGLRSPVPEVQEVISQPVSTITVSGEAVIVPTIGVASNGTQITFLPWAIASNGVTAVAVGQKSEMASTGATTAAVATTNGVDYTVTTLPSSGFWFGCVWDGNRFVAAQGGSTPKFATSIDGNIWTAGPTSFTGTYPYFLDRTIATNRAGKIAVAATAVFGSANTGIYVSTNSNLGSWRYESTGFTVAAIAMQEQEILCVSITGQYAIQRSEQSSWETGTLPDVGSTGISRCIYANGRWVVVNSEYSWVSEDGITWSRSQIFPENYRGSAILTYTNSLYVVVGTTSNNLLTSLDGLIWQARTSNTLSTNSGTANTWSLSANTSGVLNNKILYLTTSPGIINGAQYFAALSITQTNIGGSTNQPVINLCPPKNTLPIQSRIKWLTWDKDVDIAVASANQSNEQRFYYSGDGAPKVSNYSLATSGSPPYPTQFYDLGLPLPPDGFTLNARAVPFTRKDTVSFLRDSANFATIVTSGPHELRTGNIISITGFTHISGSYSQSGETITVTINNHGLINGATVTLNFTSGSAIDGTFTISGASDNTFTVTAGSSASTSGNVNLSLISFNATNVECTVVDETTFTYFSPGFSINERQFTAGRIDLSGLTQTRTYVFTWITPWGEESIASSPSEEIFLKEGVPVVVSNIPSIPPPGNNFVRGVRLYRTLPSLNLTEFFRLATLWFPNELDTVERNVDGVSRVRLKFPHNLITDDRFRIINCENPTFDITNGSVLRVIDRYTFEYAQPDYGRVLQTPVTSGTLYYDISQTLTSAPVYWGVDGNYNFFDDFDSKLLRDILITDNYDAPPEDLQGLTVIQNNILCGFVGNTLYFSEPGAPHAWPQAYETKLEYDIVGIATISGAAFVATKGYPYLVSGADPANGLSVSRIDANYPCVSKRSIVSMPYGVVYATHDGLAVYNTSSGPTLITKMLFNKDTWQREIDPTTIIAEYYGDQYFASHCSGSFIFEQAPAERGGGTFVNLDFNFTASWYDVVDGIVYCVNGLEGNIYEWDNAEQPPTVQTWKSKTITVKDMLNLGAGRVIGDFGNAGQDQIWELATIRWDLNTARWDTDIGVVFRLWVNKELEFETTLTDSDVFRLPTGYRADTFEVGVEGNVRIRAIHLAETSLGLREV